MHGMALHSYHSSFISFIFGCFLQNKLHPLNMSPKAKVFVKIYFFKFSTIFVKLIRENKIGTGLLFKLPEHHILLRPIFMESNVFNIANHNGKLEAFFQLPFIFFMWFTLKLRIIICLEWIYPFKANNDSQFQYKPHKRYK